MEGPDPQAQPRGLRVQRLAPDVGHCSEEGEKEEEFKRGRGITEGREKGVVKRGKEERGEARRGIRDKEV